MIRDLRAPTSVGEIIVEEFLKPLSLSQTALAKHLGWTQPKVNEIIQGKRGVTPETAMALADVFGTSPEFWLNAQLAMDLWKVQQEHKPLPRLPQLRPAVANKQAKQPKVGRVRVAAAAKKPSPKQTPA